MTDDKAIDRIRDGTAKIARDAIERAGLKNAVPVIVADAVARSIAAEKACEIAVGKIATLIVQVDNLQHRLAALEARLANEPDVPTRASDPGTVVRLRDVAAA